MAELEVGDRLQADHDNMFKDSVDDKIYRRVRDSSAIEILTLILAAIQTLNQNNDDLLTDQDGNVLVDQEFNALYGV